MPVSTTRTQVPGVGDASEVLIEGEGQGGEQRLELEVAPQSAALAVSLTDGGPDGHLRAPRDVAIRVTSPDGKEVPMDASVTPVPTALLLPDPQPGRWIITVSYGPHSFAQVNLGALLRGWKERLLRGGRWFSCKTCKLFLRSFIAAILVKLAPIVAGASATVQGVLTVLGQVPETMLAAIKDVFTLRDAGLPDFIALLSEYVGDPIDRALQAVCAWLGLCPPNQPRVGRRRPVGTSRVPASVETRVIPYILPDPVVTVLPPA